MDLPSYIRFNTFHCDICDEEFPYSERWCNPQPRPSDPTECVATMWVCKDCAWDEDMWMPAEEVIDRIENGKEVLGRRYLFVTV